jgi:hypothetical protein
MENLQVQRKKMSLANIEGRLTLEEMENVMAGSGINGAQCAFTGFIVAAGGLTGPGMWLNWGNAIACWYS